MNRIAAEIKNKSVLILGFGREGQSSYHFIHSIFPDKKISIADMNGNSEAIRQLQNIDKNIEFILGEQYRSRISEFELVLKSPGVFIKDHPKNISSQTELFMKHFGSQTIGITGTKGKSTTSSLIQHILKNAGKNCLLVGNIGQPPFKILDQINPETIIVYELSAHQLKDIKYSPSTGILLNIFPEHLDHFKNTENYARAKAHIFKNMKQDGVQIFNSDQKFLQKYLMASKQLSFSILKEVDCFLKDERIILNGKQIMDSKDIRNLIGKHNLQNIMAAVLACKIKAVPIEKIKDSIVSFKPLEHRLEYAGYFGGIHFYNDSIATIPEACIKALEALPKTNTLLLGGFDRGLDYKGLYAFIEKTNLENIIFMGTAGKRMLAEYPTEKKKIWVASVEEAFEHITKITAQNKICLLSPAAASYDKYKNFEERGRIFKKLAGNLKGSLPTKQ